MALQVAANLTTMFPERGALANRFAPAKAAGFKLIEISLPYYETAEALKKYTLQHNLKTILINSEPGNMQAGEMGCACVPGREAVFKENLDKSILYAKTLNCPMIHIMVGKYDKHSTEDEHHQVLERNLRYAANVLEKEGIVGLVEPKNIITFPDYYLNDFEKAVAFLFKIDSPNLRLLLDFFHMQLICGNITRNIDRLMPYTAHVQVSQPPMRSEPGSPGELDFVYILQKLKAAGYRGYVGAEYVPAGKKTEDTLEWIKQCGLIF